MPSNRYGLPDSLLKAVSDVVAKNQSIPTNLELYGQPKQEKKVEEKKEELKEEVKPSSFLYSKIKSKLK